MCALERCASRARGSNSREHHVHVLTVLVAAARRGDNPGRASLPELACRTSVDFDNSLNTAINKLRGALGDSAITLIYRDAATGVSVYCAVTGVDGTTKGTATGVSGPAAAQSENVVTVAVVVLAVELPED